MKKAVSGRRMRLRRGGGLLVGASLLATALGALGASPVASAHTLAASRQSAKLSAQCKALRTKYKGLPKTIDVAFSLNSPWGTTNKAHEVVGVEPTLLSDVASCLGFKLSYSTEGFTSVITAVETGRNLVGLAGIFLSPAREKLMAFVPYMWSETQVLTTPALAKKIHTVLDLCGLTAGVTTGSVELTYLKTLSKKCTKAGKSAIPISIFTSFTTLDAAQGAGHIEFSAGSSFLFGPEMKEFPGKLATSIFLPGTKYKMGIGVKKSDVELGQAVAAVVSMVQKEGLETKLLLHWGFTNVKALETPAIYTK